MSPFNKHACAKLSEQFAEIFQRSQDDYRALLSDLRDDEVDVSLFAERAEALTERLIKLKRIRLQITQERDQLHKSTAGEAGD